MEIMYIQHFINPLREFDYVHGRNGEIYVFHYGHFVSACENWQEVDEEIMNIYEKGMAVS